MEIEALLCSEFDEICGDFDATKIQDSWSWRNTYIAKELACLLIDDKGELKQRVLKQAIRILEANFYSLASNRYHDHARQSHLLKILRFFSLDQEHGYALKRICCPDGHQGALNLIRATLSLSNRERLTNVHARRAALSALLTSLRQNVGSCFATAPAIMIQQDQPLQFLADIGQLFGTGRLKRIYEGVEYTVPISVSWGVGDLLRAIPVASLGPDPIKTLARSPGLRAAKLTEKMLSLDIQDPFAYFTADQVIKAALKDHTRYEKAKNAFKALTDNPLLKSWEFTLASLSESKADFAKWNLYISLGIQPGEPYGIGESLQQHLQEQIDRINDEIEEHQVRYEHFFAGIKYLEGRLRSASTSSELEWLRADYRLRQQEINRVISERDILHDKGKSLANFLPLMVDFYGEKIREYFQEVYDPQMHDVSTNPYDDSPAGFRLLYKHGRANTALWTMIYSSEEYLESLTAFFIATENELRQLPAVEGIEKEVSELITVVITTIKRPEFLESSLVRLARAYNEPLSGARKPWAYVSGGTMGTLASCYYNNPTPPKEEKRWVESETELLAFFIDTIKELPLSVQKMFQQDPSRSMLAFSPTHAFLCKPGWKLFRKGWESDLYTYTWIRDLWHHPQLNFLDDHILENRMMDHLVSELLLVIPPGYRPIVQNILKTFPFPMRADEFREHVKNALSYEKWLRGGRHLELLLEELDSILYRTLPLFPEHALQERLRVLFESIDEIDDQLQKKLVQLIDKVDVGRYKIFSASDLRKFAKELLIEALKSTRSAIAFHEKISQAMWKNKFAYPEPILVADTNWVKNAFGFTVNPGTGNIDFWRFDESGTEGRPLSVWRRYINGTDHQEWGLYTAPFEYGQN